MKNKTIFIQEASEQLRSDEGDYTRLEQFLIRIAQSLLDNPKLKDLKIMNEGCNKYSISAYYHSEYGLSSISVPFRFGRGHPENSLITDKMIKQMEDNFVMNQNNLIRGITYAIQQTEEKLKFNVESKNDTKRN